MKKIILSFILCMFSINIIFGAITDTGNDAEVISKEINSDYNVVTPTTKIPTPNKNTKIVEDEEYYCTAQYDPVCAEIDVQCVKAPCPPIKKTFSNSCEAGKNKLAKILYKGKCESKEESEPPIIITNEFEKVNIPDGNVGESCRDWLNRNNIKFTKSRIFETRFSNKETDIFGKNTQICPYLLKDVTSGLTSCLYAGMDGWVNDRTPTKLATPVSVCETNIVQFELEIIKGIDEDAKVKVNSFSKDTLNDGGVSFNFGFSDNKVKDFSFKYFEYGYPYTRMNEIKYTQRGFVGLEIHPEYTIPNSEKQLNLKPNTKYIYQIVSPNGYRTYKYGSFTTGKIENIKIPEPICRFQDFSWRTDNIQKDANSIYTIYTENCIGKTIDIQLFEKDFLSDDLVKTISINIQNEQQEGIWESKNFDDGFLGGNAEVYLKYENFKSTILNIIN